MDYFAGWGGLALINAALANVAARSLRDPAGRKSILDRLARLTPESTRHWGRMETSQLLPHLAAGVRLALGERTVAGALPSGIRASLFKKLAIYYLPWPKGRIKAPPGSFDTPSLGLERDLEILTELIERFAATPSDALGASHPRFGRMSGRDWDVLQYRHLDHHLRQFGA